MKKLAIILPLIFLIASCATIDERYTGKRILVESQEYDDYYDYEDYHPYNNRYSPYYYSPFYWMGFYWGNPYFFWNPFSYYGMSSYYYGYYPGYYSGYPYYRSYRYGLPVITKKMLKKRPSRIIPKSSLRGRSGTTRSTGRISSTRSRSGSSRSTSSRTGSSGSVRKKN